MDKQRERAPIKEYFQKYLKVKHSYKIHQMQTYGKYNKYI